MAATNHTLTTANDTPGTAVSLSLTAGDLIQCQEGNVRVSVVTTDSTGGILLSGPNDTIKASNTGTVYVWLASGATAHVVSESI